MHPFVICLSDILHETGFLWNTIRRRLIAPTVLICILFAVLNIQALHIGVSGQAIPSMFLYIMPVIAVLAMSMYQVYTSQLCLSPDFLQRPAIRPLVIALVLSLSLQFVGYVGQVVGYFLYDGIVRLSLNQYAVIQPIMWFASNVIDAIFAAPLIWVLCQVSSQKPFLWPKKMVVLAFVLLLVGINSVNDFLGYAIQWFLRPSDVDEPALRLVTLFLNAFSGVIRYLVLDVLLATILAASAIKMTAEEDTSCRCGGHYSKLSKKRAN